MSYVEYGFLKINEYIAPKLIEAMEDIGEDTAVAHTGSALMWLIVAIETLVQPILMLLEDLVLWAVDSEHETHIIDHVLSIVSDPIYFAVETILDLPAMLNNPFLFLTRMQKRAEVRLDRENMIQVKMSFSSFTEELVNNYCNQNEIQDAQKRKQVFDAYENLKQSEFIGNLDTKQLYDFLISNDAQEQVTRRLVLQ